MIPVAPLLCEEHMNWGCVIGKAKQEWSGLDRLRDDDAVNRGNARRTGTIDRYTRWHLRDWWAIMGVDLHHPCASWSGECGTDTLGFALAVPGPYRLLVLLIQRPVHAGPENQP